MSDQTARDRANKGNPSIHVEENDIDEKEYVYHKL